MAHRLLRNKTETNGYQIIKLGTACITYIVLISLYVTICKSTHIIIIRFRIISGSPVSVLPCRPWHLLQCMGVCYIPYSSS